MSTRIFKFNLNNNYGQCGGGSLKQRGGASLKQRGGGKFKQGDRVIIKNKNGNFATILKVADDNEFGMLMVSTEPHYVITIDGVNNKEEVDGVINVNAGNGTYHYIASEKELELNPISSSIFGGLVNGMVNGLSGLLPSSTSFNVGDKVPKNDDDLSDIFLKSTSATSEMPSPSPGKPNLVASQTSSAMNLGPKPTGVSETSSALNTQMQKPTRVSETSSAFNTQMRKPTCGSTCSSTCGSTCGSETSPANYRDIPLRITSVTSPEEYSKIKSKEKPSATSSEEYSQIPQVVSRKEGNLKSSYANIPMRKSANRQNGGFYNESMLGQYGGFNEERKIYSYADIPIRTKPTFN